MMLKIQEDFEWDESAPYRGATCQMIRSTLISKASPSRQFEFWGLGTLRDLVQDW